MACEWIFFFFNDTATTEIYTLSLHDALPISVGGGTAPARSGSICTSRKRQTAASIFWIRLVDRKSTRLNSSHSQISYAVFCLKKKKKNILTQSLVIPALFLLILGLPVARLTT